MITIFSFFAFDVILNTEKLKLNLLYARIPDVDWAKESE